jgi:hypothetical protein
MHASLLSCFQRRRSSRFTPPSCLRDGRDADPRSLADERRAHGFATVPRDQAGHVYTVQERLAYRIESAHLEGEV